MTPKRIYDLSIPTEMSASEALSVSITHQTHEELAQSLADFLGCSIGDFPDRLGYANDEVVMNAHTGTHLDAPWHYFPTSEGLQAKTIDEVPLEWCIGSGVVLDMRHKPQGSLVTVDDLQTALEKIDYRIQKDDIVYIQTGADKHWGTKEYFDSGCGMGYESTLWLIEQGSRVMGIDAWGWDRPFWAIREAYKSSGDREILWAAHRAGRDKEFCHIEKLANLDTLPKPWGFTTSCFPVKLVGGSAGWCRAVAWYDE